MYAPFSGLSSRPSTLVIVSPSALHTYMPACIGLRGLVSSPRLSRYPIIDTSATSVSLTVMSAPLISSCTSFWLSDDSSRTSSTRHSTQPSSSWRTCAYSPASTRLRRMHLNPWRSTLP